MLMYTLANNAMAEIERGTCGMKVLIRIGGLINKKKKIEGSPQREGILWNKGTKLNHFGTISTMNSTPQ